MMRPGSPRYHRLSLNPELRTAYREQLRSTSGLQLALQAGFPHPTNLSSLLHAPQITASPLTLVRLRRLARLIGFEGPIFVEQSADEAVAS